MSQMNDQAPQGPASTQKSPAPVGSRRPPTREPQRHLDPSVARAITAAKIRTGRSWRQITVGTPLSHSHAINVANAKRVPSRYVAEILIDLLDLDDQIATRLRAVAVPTWRQMPWQGSAGFDRAQALPMETTGTWELGDVDTRHGWASR